jgi:hypothetical protein
MTEQLLPQDGFPADGPGGSHGDFSHEDAAAAAARILGGNSGNVPSPNAAPPGVAPNAVQQPALGEGQAASANTDTNRAEQANADLVAALRDPSTVNTAYGAHIKERPTVDNAGNPVPDASPSVLKYSPNAAEYTATIQGPGSRVDLQNSSHLGFAGPEGSRTKTNEPVLVTLSDGTTRQTFAYDNQILTEIPPGWDDAARSDWESTGGSAASWQDHAANAFNLPPSSSLTGASGRANPQVERARLLQDRVAETVTDEFVEGKTWSHADHQLPTELVVGEAFGGDVMGDKRVESVVVGSSALEHTGRIKEPDFLNNRQYEQVGSPVNSAVVLQRAVHERDAARRGPQTPEPLPPQAATPPVPPVSEGTTH